MTSDRPSVLVVEDEPELAEIFSIWLSDVFSVDAVTRGAEALDRLAERPDAIVLDWRIPDVSGEEILEAIRAEGMDVRIAVITGADPDLIGVDDDVDIILRKPVRSEELVAAIEDLTV